VIRRALIGGSNLRTTGIITLLRLSPLLPFETSNVVLSMCGVRPLPFFVGTMLGIAPRAAAIVWVASTMRELTLHTAPPTIVIVTGAVATVASIIMLVVISKHALERACATGEPVCPAPQQP
jgi:uncharacterized membrane protein YdjX (TVP38/TMEM64 family)